LRASGRRRPDALLPSKEHAMIRLSACMVAALAFLAATTALAQAPASIDAAIDDLVVANRILAERGIIDAYGHVSIRHPADPQRYLMARALSPALITAPDIMEFDLNSNPIDRRDRSLFSERFIHGEIYKVRPDVNASSTPRRSCGSACRSSRSARPAA
jgi:hypothetical protein